MKTLELFAGKQSFSQVARVFGHETFTTDNNPAFANDLTIDVRQFDSNSFVGKIDVLWASPPCEGFSVAAIGKNWNHDHTPKTDSARLGMELLQKTIEIIEAVKPRYWFIENPRGKMRKMPFLEVFLKHAGGVRHTVWYCRYGDKRAKPTDIWTNCLEWRPRPQCKNGGTDHEAAPRGAKTGTQGISGYADRSVIPKALFEDIFNAL